MFVYMSKTPQPNNTERSDMTTIPYIFVQSDNFILFGDTVDMLSAASGMIANDLVETSALHRYTAIGIQLLKQIKMNKDTRRINCGKHLFDNKSSVS